MLVDNIFLGDVEREIASFTIVKKKRERAVYHFNDEYYKVWVPNWTQGDITKFALDSGFYDQKTDSCLKSLLYDDSGQRGYICVSGVQFSSWENVNNKTTLEQRKSFLYYLIINGLNAGGIYADLAPSNMVLCGEKLSLIDLDGYRSFNLIFNGEREWYEKFELDAWWKPYETAKRDVDKFYRKYLSACLGVEYNKTIASADNFTEIKHILENLT